MKQKARRIADNKNYTAIDIGDWSDLKSYSYIHPKNGNTVTGKVFLKELIKSTGTEISISTLPPHKELGFFHIHHKDEETYIILNGSGFCQVDDDYFPIKQGSVIRVAPEGIRSLCNTSDEEMLYICIQSRENSLKEYSTDDGSRIEHNPQWSKSRKI